MKRVNFHMFLFLAVGAVLFTGAPSLAQTNLLINPGFEDLGGSYNGWFTFGSGVQLSTAATDNIMRTGAAASKVYGEFTGCPGSKGFTVGGYGQSFVPTVGQEYMFTGYSYVDSLDAIPDSNLTCNGNRLIAKIVFFDAAAGGNEIQSNEIIIGDHNTPFNQWVYFSVSAPAPAGALRVEALILFLQPGCDEGSVFVDDLTFYDFTKPAAFNVLFNPSFDTDLTGWNVFGNVYYDGRSFARRTTPGAAKLYSTFTPDSPSGMYQQWPVTGPGIERFFLDAYAMTTCVEDPISDADTVTNYVVARIVFRDVGLGEVGSNEVVLCDNTSPLGTWQRRVVTAVAPAGAVYAEAYILFISPTLQGGAVFVDDVGFISDWVGYTTGIHPEGRQPGFALEQNVPNPFNPSTRINFRLDAASQVEINVYDVAGRYVTTLLNEHVDAGPHYVNWDGRTINGEVAAAGMYWYVMKTDMGQQSRRMMLLK